MAMADAGCWQLTIELAPVEESAPDQRTSGPLLVKMKNHSNSCIFQSLSDARTCIRAGRVVRSAHPRPVAQGAIRVGFW